MLILIESGKEQITLNYIYNIYYLVYYRNIEIYYLGFSQLKNFN